MSADDEYDTLDDEQKSWVKERLYQAAKYAAFAKHPFPLEGPEYEQWKSYLIQRAKAQQETNGPEKWHDALTKYTELEKRVAALEQVLANILRTTDFRLFK